MASLALDPALSYIDNFQAEVDRLGCTAIVHPARGVLPADTIELWDGEGRFITLLPMSISPETAVLGFGLFQLGLRTGRRMAGETVWRSRHLSAPGAPTGAEMGSGRGEAGKPSRSSISGRRSMPQAIPSIS